jgi:hypothetical protein
MQKAVKQIVEKFEKRDKVREEIASLQDKMNLAKIEEANISAQIECVK